MLFQSQIYPHYLFDYIVFIIMRFLLLNKKNIVNYNISLSDFNIKNILKYYIYLLNEKEKGQIELNDLKKEVGELREDYLKVKKDEINNSKANSNILDDKNFDTINIEKLSPVSRYKNDIKFFENLIINTLCNFNFILN